MKFTDHEGHCDLKEKLMDKADNDKANGDDDATTALIT